jgi:hypothetical protein
MTQNCFQQPENNGSLNNDMFANLTTCLVITHVKITCLLTTETSMAPSIGVPPVLQSKGAMWCITGGIFIWELTFAKRHLNYWIYRNWNLMIVTFRQVYILDIQGLQSDWPLLGYFKKKLVVVLFILQIRWGREAFFNFWVENIQNLARMSKDRNL